MNTRKKWSRQKPLKKTIWVLAVVIMLVCSQQAWASTAANTTITNTVTVSYSNAAGVGQPDETATASFRVLLVAAAPTLDSPASIDPTTENTLNVVTYTITSNANGQDDYTLSTANGHDANLNAASLVVNGGTAGTGDPVNGTNIILGGTTLAAVPSIGTNLIIVPYDSNADGDATSTNGISEGDTIMIGGNPYVVDTGGISEDSGTNLTTITLLTNIVAPAGNIGDVVGERATFTVDATTSTLTSGSFGVYTLSTTAASATVPAETTTQATATLITVRRPQLSVAKYVQNIDSPVVGSGTTIGPLNTRSGGGSLIYYSQGITGVVGEELEYIIVVDNPVGGGVALDVTIEDQIPQFTTYVNGSMLVDPGTGVFAPVTDVETDTDKGEFDGTAGSETVWIYAGTGGGDTGAGTTYGDGTGGSMNGGETTRGAFRVQIQ